MYKKRLDSLRGLMQEQDLSAFIILMNDTHMNEYISEHFKKVEFFSGFSGSAGTLLVSLQEAFLITDGRYSLQAQKELSKSGVLLASDLYQNLNFKKGSKIAINAKTLPVSLKKELQKKLKAKNLKLVFSDIDDKAFSPRPKLIFNEIYKQERRFMSEKRAKKLALIKNKIKESGANAHLISSLDDIAWLLNLRGEDIEFNPVFFAYALLIKDELRLFVRLESLGRALKTELEKEGIKLFDYDSLSAHLKQIKAQHFLLDADKTSFFIYKIIKKNNQITLQTNPSTLIKAYKNAKEISHIKDAMIADGIALCEFFAWLESALKRPHSLSELDIEAKLLEFRAKNPLFISLSFATIAGFGPNSAIIHYKAKKDDFARLKKDNFLLIDSGAQYQNGTTDITRVVATGKLSLKQKSDYTLVLKALIQLSLSVFPQNINLALIDALARHNLWQMGLDYAHGTGHGVGYFLNVHERGISISQNARNLSQNKAQKGAVTSIEPGIYRKNEWGVRLENLALITEMKGLKEKDFGTFLGFKTLTLCPFDKNAIQKSLLTKEELSWLNHYHQRVFKLLSPHLKGEVLKWLEKHTRPL